jgi:3-oxoacyl-[acyl-carrier-protein] synthase-3
MRFDEPLFIASAASYLPEVVPFGTAVAEGRIDEEHRELGFESVAVADDLSGPEMAVRAGRLALERAEGHRDDIGLLLHMSGGFQGYEFWPAAAYVSLETLGASVPGFDVQQRCNAGLGAVSLAAAQIAAGFTSAVLLTTGDSFALPWVDRWTAQDNLFLADGGTALVLSGREGFARLVSHALGADNSLERWSRGLRPPAKAPGLEMPLQLAQRSREHAATPEAEGSWDRYEAELHATTQRALADAGVTTEDIARVVVPFIHRGKTPENHDVLGFTEKQSCWELGRRVGHMGPADQFLGLEHLVAERAVGPGDLVLLVAAGAGFSFSAAVVEILTLPSW